jgi:hypothetical protein
MAEPYDKKARDKDPVAAAMIISVAAGSEISKIYLTHYHKLEEN